MFSEVAVPLSIMGMLVPFLVIGIVMAGGAILWGIWKSRQGPSEQPERASEREQEPDVETGPETGPETETERSTDTGSETGGDD